ncbi:swarming motility protein SwrC [Paenibacillus marchantiophytorum]|uniref:Swarming motility protein SwrC n=1 Tax=Paenibacillus marchantiophytorum TaxID=1619310 RepID=A0ABQ2BPI9_9BACL|nr:efflux RND transporter permease subunit [Paenibacillus marchantiophytorum]GGI44533.1 swarming motility protein SwrC [Paenibacillus marchantiophytorum]
MTKLTEFSMKNVAAVCIVIWLLIAGGCYAAANLKVESMPDIAYPIVIISTDYTAPPKDVMELVTKPLEKAVAGMQGLLNISSSSQDNYSQIVIRLEQGKKPENVKKDVESLIANVRLPQGSEKPRVLTAGFASEPIYHLALYAEEGTNQTELDQAFKDMILPGLEGIKGIDHVDSFGNREAVLTIKLDGAAMNRYGLTPPEVSRFIQGALVSSPAGTVDFNGNHQMLRVKGQLDSIYSLDHMKIGTPEGEMLLLKQIAKVEAISESANTARLDDKPAITVLLYKTKDANTVEFAGEVDKQIASWQKTLNGVKFHLVLNGATSVKESIHGMVQEGGLGALLASLMILIFLRNVRMTFIVLVSIPLSILITLLFMNPLGISLNIMTLGGMAIAIGRVVDDSIVVIENIYSQMEKAQERSESVIKLATQQVASAITSSTLTTVGVFAPIGFVSGIVGEVFRPFALTLICALLSSLLVALTVIPMLAKLMVLKGNSIPHQNEKQATLFMLRYQKMLEWSLTNRIKTLLFAALLFVLSIVVTVPHLATSFMPANASERQMVFTIQMPRGTSLEMMNAQSKDIETLLKDAKNASGQSIFSYNESIMGADWADIYTESSVYEDAKMAFKQYKEKIAERLPEDAKVNGKVFSFGPGTGSGVDFSYLLTGDDQLYLQQAARQIENKLREFPELTEIKNSLSETKTEVEITVDESKAMLYGFTAAQVLENVNSWIKEEKLGDLTFNHITYATKVMLDNKYKDSMDKLGSYMLKSANGKRVQINEIAKIKQVDAPVSISREMQSQVLTVTAQIDSADKGGISKKISAELAKIELPLGVSREVKGVSGDINKSFMEMFMAMIASIFIVYLVMVLAFGNASAPFAILFCLPLAAIGGLLGLFVTGESLNVTSLIGFLMLIGIVVTNAIVLIDRVQQLVLQGHPLRQSLIEAGMTRLRPIIMTAGATVMALMPLALSLSKGTIVSKGLAVVVIGGLSTSTLLTLVVVPIMYEWIYSIKIRRRFIRDKIL